MNLEMNYIDRKFEHCVIKWEIRNYCISPRDLDWTIYSPDFYIRGFQLSKWKMILKPLLRKDDEECSLLFELRRLECNSNWHDVWADCKLCFSDGTEKHVLGLFESAFSVNSKYETILDDFCLTGENSVHSNIFNLRLEILVHYQGVEEEVSACTDLGIKKLSEDLGVLYETSEMFDINLKIGDEFIQAHKAILYHRLRKPYIKETISNFNQITLDIADSYGVWDKVLRFLYTANMEYAVTEPTLNTYESAVSIGVKPIILYYEPNELILNTTTEVEEFNFTWTVKGILSRSELYLLSPKVIGTMDTSFRLKIYPRGFGKKQKYTGVFVEIEGGAPKDVCVDFSLMNDKRELNLKRIHKRIMGKEIFGDKNLVERETLAQYIQNGNVTIGLRLRMPTGAQRSSLGKSVIKSEPYSEQLNYEQLSEDMVSLYNDSKFRDFVFYVDESKYNVNVHKCIVSVRHRTLFSAYFGGNQDVFHSLKVGAVNDLLYFIYCGEFSNSITLPNIYYLYQMAENVNIPSLKHALIRNLERKLTLHNITDIYKFAESKNVESLKAYVLRFIDNTPIR